MERNYRHKFIKFVTKSIDEYFEPEEGEIDLVVESTESSELPVIDPWLHSEECDSFRNRVDNRAGVFPNSSRGVAKYDKSNSKVLHQKVLDQF
jgi:hypothetical protein